MLKLDKKLRDEIATFLNGIVVPAYVGANIKVVVDALNKLEEIPEAPVEEKK